MDDTARILEKYSPDRIFSKNYNLNTVRAFLNYIGNPQESFKIIHIAGTSGKGSTTAFASNILKVSGFKVGAFYSPHVVTVRERILVDQEMLSPKYFNEQLKIVEAKMLKFVAETGNRKLTYFEILMALAFSIYKAKKVDVAVIEVGMGGKLDATNVVQSDIAVLTNVGLDHVHILGDTVEKIADDKTEIIKPGSVCITGVEQDSVKSIVQKKGRLRDVEILYLDKEFGYSKVAVSIDTTVFDYWSGKLKMESVEISLTGEHQVKNAAIAIAAVTELLNKMGKGIKVSAIRKGLHSTTLPGRIDIKSKQPLIIWDAAHNEDKMSALVETIDTSTKGEILLLLAFKKGQNADRLLKPLRKLSRRVKKVCLTRYKVVQDLQVESETTEVYVEKVRKLLPHSEIIIIPECQEAYSLLLKEQLEDQILLVTGSFYLLNALVG